MAGSGSPLGINERKEIKRLLGKMSMTKIAERLNRSKNCVITEVRLNGGPEEYDPVKAHKRADTVQKEGRERANIINELRNAVRDAKNDSRFVLEEMIKLGQQREELREILSQVKGIKVLLPMIQKLDERIVKLEELAFSNVKPLYIESLTKRIGVLERKVKAFLDRSPTAKEVVGLPKAPTCGRFILVCDWSHYRSWPSQNDINRFIKERETNGFHRCCFKPGRQWVIDENRYIEWEKDYREQIESKAINTEVT